MLRGRFFDTAPRTFVFTPSARLGAGVGRVYGDCRRSSAGGAT